MIDNVSKDNFLYMDPGTQVSVGEFGWEFNFKWRIPMNKDIYNDKRQKTDAYICPIMAGGLFSIDKDFFYQVGSYDEDMEFWGGENVEMSVRVSSCQLSD